MNIYGMKVNVSPMLGPRPVLKLSIAVPVSDAFRIEMDAWLLEMFGTKDDIIVCSDTMFLSANNYALIRNIT